MPLKKGASRRTIEQNIKEMVKSGRKPSQAAAAAYASARKAGQKDKLPRGTEKKVGLDHPRGPKTVIKDLGAR